MMEILDKVMPILLLVVLPTALWLGIIYMLVSGPKRKK